MTSRGGLIAALALVAAACGGGDSTATPASDGDTVGVFYRGTLDDGTEFDSNIGGQPLVFVLGEGSLIDGFENAVRGMAVGETVTVRLQPAEAYGERDESRILELPAEGAPEGLIVGQRVQFGSGGAGTILEITEDFITVDTNHQLAGQALTFEITIESIDPG
jgi:FKBP-type peptidyl-prolyl cis-trans isomerase 2